MEKTAKNSRSIGWLVAILLLGTVLRLAWIYYVRTEPISDFKHYSDLAMSLLRRGSYTLPEGLDYLKASTPYLQQGVPYPSAFRPPGYPFFLALLYFFSPTFLAAKLANVVLGDLWIFCIYLLGRRYFSERVGLCAALLTAIFPPAVGYTSILATEILAVTLLLLILCAHAYRWGGRWNPFWLGLLMGFLSLVKPYFFVFPLLYALLLWWQWREGGENESKGMGGSYFSRCRQNLGPFLRHVGWPVVTAALAMVLLISPWTVRNYLVFHRFVPISTNGDFVLYINNNELSQGMYMDALRVPHSIFLTNRILNAQGQYNEADAMKLAGEEAKKWILAHPRDAFLLGLDRWAASYFNAGNEIWEWAMDKGEILIPAVWVTPLLQGARAFALVAVGSGLFYALLLLVLSFRRRPMNLGHKIQLLFVLFFLAVIFASEGQPRYVFTSYPFFLLGMAWMMDRLAAAVGEERPNG